MRPSSAAWAHDASDLGGGPGLVREGAERALADHGVEAVIVDGEVFGVADSERGPFAEPGGRGAGGRLGDLGGAEVDAGHVDVVLGGEEHGGDAETGCDVEDMLVRAQVEQGGEAPGELDAAGVVALAEEQADQVDPVDRSTTRLRRLGIPGGAGPVRVEQRAEVGERWRRGHCSVRPRLTCTGASAVRPGTVREPWLVGTSRSTSSTALGTTGATGEPESWARICSR